MKLNFRRTARSRSGRFTQGFTLLEMLVVLVMIGAVLAIASPGFLAFLNTHQLRVGQEEVLLAMRSAQSQAKLNRRIWQFSVREVNGIVQWAVHPAAELPGDAQWQALNPSVQMDSSSSAGTPSETTLQQVGGVRRVQFDDRGETNGQLGRLTLRSRMNPQLKRCVIVSTLLGEMRLGHDHPTKQDGRYCY